MGTPSDIGRVIGCASVGSCRIEILEGESRKTSSVYLFRMDICG